MKPKIGIIGLGHVGNVMANLFAGHAEITTYDIRQDQNYPQAEFSECDLGVVCVGTPTLPDGKCDTSQVRNAISRAPMANVLLKSTVPPGTTDQLAQDTGKSICFSPEYVGQSNYYNPLWDQGALSVPFVIVGGAPAVRSRVIEMLLPIMGPSKTYFQCGALEAEIIKYMENSFLATKISFVNEFYNICDAFGADWHTVREGWLLDPRIGSSHTAVFARERGFDGKCLPKDLGAIVHACSAAGYEPELLREVLMSNDRFRNAE